MSENTEILSHFLLRMVLESAGSFENLSARMQASIQFLNDRIQTSQLQISRETVEKVLLVLFHEIICNKNKYLQAQNALQNHIFRVFRQSQME